MLPGFEIIVEERIKEGQKKGEFDNLPGSGKPINLINEGHIPDELRLAHKILKNADCLPPELELKKEIHQTEELLAGLTDEKEKYKTIKKLNYLVLKFNSLRPRAISMELPQEYTGKIVERLESAHRRYKGE
jgi:hypothetical protein